MRSVFDDVFALWMWPWKAAQFGSDLTEMVTGAQRVVQARLPAIEKAMRDPLRADHKELTRMVSEKVGAFHASGRVIRAAGDIAQRASRANVKAGATLAGGGFLWIDDWMRLAEANLAAMVALSALPAAVLAPVHREVMANDRRLRP